MLFLKVDNMFVPIVWLSSISLLVCEFKIQTDMVPTIYRDLSAHGQ